MMTATEEAAVQVDGDKRLQFVFRVVDEVGATLNTALVVMGDKLGLYRALAAAGPLSAAELAGAPACLPSSSPWPCCWSWPLEPAWRTWPASGRYVPWRAASTGSG
jgi:hypothetical protein